MNADVTISVALRPLREDDAPGILVSTHRGWAKLLAVHGEFCWLKYLDWNEPETHPLHMALTAAYTTKRPGS